MTRPAVSVHELTRRFGTFTAVDAVTFDVAPGEIFGFLGPNGAGKTTTIKMLTALLRPSGGTALVAGHDVASEPEAVRQRIGYMSQRFSLYADLTVEENITLFGGLYSVSGTRFAERRDWVLEMAGLADRRHQLTAHLALGFKQRLALGCALLHEPPILFLDEPTSGVDPRSRRRFWELIDGMAEAGATVLVSTHYMEEAEYCHRLALMNRGRLIGLDRPAALRQSVVEPILEVEVADAARAADALRDVPGLVEVALFGRALHVVATDEAAARHEITTTLSAHGHGVTSLRRVAPSLEDVFVALVRREGGVVAG